MSETIRPRAFIFETFITIKNVCEIFVPKIDTIIIHSACIAEYSYENETISAVLLQKSELWHIEKDITHYF